jgi:hypothetical protein
MPKRFTTAAALALVAALSGGCADPTSYQPAGEILFGHDARLVGSDRSRVREQFRIREVARRTDLSRKTIGKYLRADTVEPRFAIPERPGKLDPFAEKLAGGLKTEAGKWRKRRWTSRQLHAHLVALGFTGPYERMGAFARECGRGVSARSRRRTAVPSRCWLSGRAKRSSSPGARTTLS